MNNCEIKRLIFDGKTDDALDLLRFEILHECTQKNLVKHENQILILSSEFHSLKADNIMHFISRDEYTASLNRINGAILEIINSPECALNQD